MGDFKIIEKFHAANLPADPAGMRFESDEEFKHYLEFYSTLQMTLLVVQKAILDTYSEQSVSDLVIVLDGVRTALSDSDDWDYKDRKLQEWIKRHDNLPSDDDDLDYLARKMQNAISDITSASSVEVEFIYDSYSIWGEYSNSTAYIPPRINSLKNECASELEFHLRFCPDDIFNCIDYVRHSINYETYDVDLAICGKRDGKVIRGNPDNSVVTEAPAFGNWWPIDAVTLEGFEIKEPDKNIPRIKELCEQIVKWEDVPVGNHMYMIEDNILNLDATQIELQANNIMRFIRIFSELGPLLVREYPDYDVLMENVFLDNSETGPNLMSISVTYAGEVSMKLQQGPDERYKAGLKK